MEKTIAHKRVYPVSTPANVHVVTVPGPIKAAAINVLGPKNLFFFNELLLMNSKVAQAKMPDSCESRDIF